jgi:hypothetical protein
MIKRPADCEIRSVIRFLNARNVKPADIHHQICEVCGENAVSDGMVRKWVRKFNEGRGIYFPNMPFIIKALNLLLTFLIHTANNIRSMPPNVQ